MDKEKIQAMQEIIENGFVTGRVSGKQSGMFKKAVASKSAGTVIYEALEKKTFYKEPDSKTILAFTDEMLIEVSDSMQDEIINAIEKFTNVFKKNAVENGMEEKKVAEILEIYEGAYSAYLHTPKFERLRKELSSFLKEQYENGDDKTKREMNKGYITFFAASKANISRGILKFPNMRIRVNKKGEKIPDESISKLSIKVDDDKESLRNEFIFDMLSNGLWDYDYLLENGIVAGLGGYDVNSFIRESTVLTPEQKVEAFIVSGVCKDRNEVLEYYKNNNKKFFIQIANVKELIDSIKERVIDPKDAVKRLKIEDVSTLLPEDLEELLSIPGFPKNTDFLNYVQNKKENKTDKVISKKLFDVLDRNQIMRIVMSKNIVYSNSLESKDYIDMFGRLNLDDIKVLRENYMILPEDLIKLSKYTSLEKDSSNDYQELLDYLLDVYDVDMLENLKNQGKINQAFIDTFNTKVIAKVSEEKRNAYFDRFYNDLSGKENNEELLLQLVSSGFSIPSNKKVRISFDVVQDMYLEDKIDDATIIDLYKKGFVDSELIKSMYSSNDILENYKAGNLEPYFLNFVDNRQDVIRQELESKKLSTQDVILLYADKDGIDIEELKYIFEKQTLEDDNLAEYIPEDIDETKIEGLFENYFISHDDLSVLVSRGIISSEAAEEYANKMNTHDTFESIFGNVTRAILTHDTETGESRTPGLRGGPNKRAGQIKNDPVLIDMLYDEIGFDDRRLVLHGENNSLDGYTVRASDKYGLMAFTHQEKPGNATYIMSLQQGLFFLNRLVRKRALEDGTEIENITGVQSSATKQELRETEHVKVRNASKWLGRNIVDSMRKISDKFARDYRKEKDYKDKIDELVDVIKEDYDERRGLHE